MGCQKTPWTDALFGIFMQEMREIRKKHSRCFRNRYFTFEYTGKMDGGFRLIIEPEIPSKLVKREIEQAFDRRLNQDVLSGSRVRKRKIHASNL